MYVCILLFIYMEGFVINSILLLLLMETKRLLFVQ